MTWVRRRRNVRLRRVIAMRFAGDDRGANSEADAEREARAAAAGYDKRETAEYRERCYASRAGQ